MHRRSAGARLLSFQREHLRGARHDRITAVEPSTLTRAGFDRPAPVEPQYGRGLLLIVIVTVLALVAWAAFSPSLDQVLPASAVSAEVSR